VGVARALSGHKSLEDFAEEACLVGEVVYCNGELWK